jgi:hypothetical protein
MRTFGAWLLKRAKAGSETGVVVVYLALAMVMLLAVTAVAIDIGNAWQQQRYAQGIADAAALSAAQGLSDTAGQCSTDFVTGEGCAYQQGFYYAFGSLNLPRPSTGLSCGVNCQYYTDTAANRTVVIDTNWQGNTNWVHVRVCWSVPTFFGKVVGVDTLSPCGAATAQVVAPTSHTSSGCTGGTYGELTSPSTITAPVGSGSVTGTMSATYRSTIALNPTTVSFIAPNAFGQLVALAAPGQGSVLDPSYTLTDNGGANGPFTDVTIAYQIPSGLATASGSLFVTDSSGANCGIVAWSTCQILSNDDFFEPPSTGGRCFSPPYCTQNDSDDPTSSPADLEADAGDMISPKPGSTITPGTSFWSQFFDETPPNPAAVVLAVDGTFEPITWLPWGSGGPASTTPVALPADPYTNDGHGTYGTGSANVSSVCDDTHGFGGGFTTGRCARGSYGGTGNRVCQPGAATVASTAVVTLCDYMGDGLPGRLVDLVPTNTTAGVVGVTCASGSGPTCVTKADGTAAFTLTDTANETVDFMAQDLSDGVPLAENIAVTFSGGTPTVTITPAPDQTPCTGSSLASCGVIWTQTELAAPYGSGNSSTSVPTNFGVFPSFTLPSTLQDGWHSAFVYEIDTDQNKSGGDCAMTQWPFAFIGGKGSITLVQ